MGIEQFLAQNSQTMGAASQAANIAMQLGSMGLQYHMFKDAQRFNSAESAKQRRFAVEQWQRETAYNTPAAQIERLKAAGINPALAYVDGSLANTAGSSPSLSEAQSPSAPHMTAPQVDPLTAAQIENIKADTEQKRGITKGKEIQNSVDQMTFDAFRSAYEDGLVEDAIKSGFEQDIISSRISRWTFAQAAWDFAVYTGLSLSSSATLGGDGTGRANFTVLPSEINESDEFTSYPNLSLHRDLFKSNYEAQSEANRAARQMAKLQLQENDKDFDIWSEINKAAGRGELWAKIARVGLWIAKQRFNLPSISLSVKGSDKSIHNVEQTGNHWHGFWGMEK